MGKIITLFALLLCATGWGQQLNKGFIQTIPGQVAGLGGFVSVGNNNFSIPPDTNVCVIGNSTIASYLSQTAVSELLPEDWVITDVSYPGHTILQQRTAFQNLSTSIKKSFDYVFVQIGLNDLVSSETAATALSRYQILIDTINSQTNVNTKIIVCTMIPCRQRLIDLYGATNGPKSYQKWIDMNHAIMGNGNHKITGIDSYVNIHTVLLNDGNGNLKAEYDMGDHIHETTAARQIIANYWVREARNIFSIESKKLLYRFNSLTEVQVYGIDSMVTMLKDSSIWNNSDLIYAFNVGEEADAKMMWKDTLYTLTGAGVYTFTAKSGFASNGSTGVLKTGWIPSTNSIYFDNDSGYVAIYSNTNSATGAVGEFGVLTNTNRYLFLALDNNGVSYFALNSGLFNNSAINNTIGLFILNRVYTTLNVYQNNVGKYSDNGLASPGLPTKEMYILGYNNDGTLGSASPRQMAYFSIGGNLSTAQIRALNNIIIWWNAKVTSIF